MFQNRRASWSYWFAWPGGVWLEGVTFTQMGCGFIFCVCNKSGVIATSFCDSYLQKQFRGFDYSADWTSI